MIRPTSDYGADPARAQHDHRATTAAPGNRGQRIEETSSRAVRIERIALSPTKVSKTMRRISSSRLDKSAHGYVNWN